MGINHTSEHLLPDEAATLTFAACFARALESGLVIYLQGDLGSGKTTFTRGVLQGLGYRGRVKSPTYTLVESYPCADFTLHHFDLYRFVDPEEWDDAGFREYFGSDTVCLVEWPEQARALLPSPDLELALSVSGTGRHYRFTAFTEAGSSCLARHTTQAAASC